MAIKIVDDREAKKKFKIKCEYCGCIIEYELTDLRYRLWYPHGFIYCPNCRKPLRHGAEELQVKNG